MKRFELLLLALIVLVVVSFLYITWSDCTDVSGVLVRGLFWLECIK